MTTTIARFGATIHPTGRRLIAVARHGRRSFASLRYGAVLARSKDANMTTTIDDRKKNATTLYEALKAFATSQRKWNSRVSWRAPKNLAEPDWHKLRIAAQQFLKALDLDFGPWSGSFTANHDYIRDVGILKQVIGRTILTQSERQMLLTAIRDLRDESRQIAGIKRRTLADVIAGKVAQQERGSDDGEPFVPTDNDLLILRVMNNAGRVLNQGQIHDRLHSAKTRRGATMISQRLAIMAKVGVVRHPIGKLRGWAITNKGGHVLEITAKT